MPDSSVVVEDRDAEEKSSLLPVLSFRCISTVHVPFFQTPPASMSPRQPGEHLARRHGSFGRASRVGLGARLEENGPALARADELGLPLLLIEVAAVA